MTTIDDYMNLLAFTKTLFSRLAGLMLANLLPERHPDSENIRSLATLVGGQACMA